MEMESVLGTLGILAFVGSSRLNEDFGEKGARLLDSFWFRKLIVFAIAFIYSRNFMTALTITVVYLFIVTVVFYEKEPIEAAYDEHDDHEEVRVILP